MVREFNIPTFVLTMATRAAYTCVKVGEAACACMIDLAIRPLKEQISNLTDMREREKHVLIFNW